ncbi:MAG: esterase [Planctomycetaceae bacterium]|nr:esterase [Planctomycetaceae bacterium]
MTWTTELIGGKAVDIFIPASTPLEPFAILHLHGHSEQTLKDNEVYSQELEKRGLRCVCPHGRRSWWLDQVCSEYDKSMTPHAYLLNTLLPWMEETWQISPPAIGLTGISMGGQGVLQLAYRHAREFPIVAALAPAVDFYQWHGRGLPIDEMFETAEAARQASAILHLHPLSWPRHQFIACDPADDEWFDSADKLSMKLYSSGIPHEVDFKSTNGGHTWDYFEMMAGKLIGWTHEQLQSVARRV